MMSMLFIASCTCDCACTVFWRAFSSSRFDDSCWSLPRMVSRPCLSFSTTSVCDAMVGSAPFASLSDCIWRWRATRASASNLSAFGVLPAFRYSSAFWLAARALRPQSCAAWTSSRWSSSIIRRLPMVWATALSASRMLSV